MEAVNEQTAQWRQDITSIFGAYDKERRKFQKDHQLTSLQEVRRHMGNKVEEEQLKRLFLEPGALTEADREALSAGLTILKGKKARYEEFLRSYDRQYNGTLSQQDIADQLGISPSYLNQLLRFHPEKTEKNYDTILAKFQELRSMRQRRLILGLGLGMGVLGTACGWAAFLINNRHWQEQYQSYQLWSTVLEEVTEARHGKELRRIYEKILAPIFELAGPSKRDHLLNMLENGQQKSSPKPVYLTDLDYGVFKARQLKGEQHIVYYGEKEPLLYDFSGGVCSFSQDLDGKPDHTWSLSRGLRDSIAMQFSDFNDGLAERARTSERPPTHPTLENGLEQVLKLQQPGNYPITPVLIYALFFHRRSDLTDRQPQYEQAQAYMYRFPKYVRDDDNAPLQPYLNYDHTKRPFFQDFINRRGLCLQAENEQGEGGIWLSSVYSDYGHKTIRPIRTLMFRECKDDGMYLLCIDFKYKD